MKSLTVALFVFSVSWGVYAKEPIAAQPIIRENRNLHLQFPQDSERRYTVEVSSNAEDWTRDYSSPHLPSAEGLWVRQLSEYSPRREFYRVDVLPWRFRSVYHSDNWIADLELAMSPDGTLGFVFQDRDTNRLHYGETLPDGLLTSPEQIATTGAMDEPGGWDDSGYNGVELSFSNDGTPYVFTLDDTTAEIVFFRRSSDTGDWIRHAITDPLPTHFWAAFRSRISSTGKLAVVYSIYADGVYLAHAEATAPEEWTHVKLTDNGTPNLRFGSLEFCSNGDLLVFFGEPLRVGFTPTFSVVPASIPGMLSPGLSPTGELVVRRNSTAGDGMRIFRSNDNGLTWTDEYFDFLCGTAFGPNGDLSFFGGANGEHFHFNGSEWIGTKVTRRNSQSSHLVDSKGKVAVLLKQNDGTIRLATED